MRNAKMRIRIRKSAIANQIRISKCEMRIRIRKSALANQIRISHFAFRISHFPSQVFHKDHMGAAPDVARYAPFTSRGDQDLEPALVGKHGHFVE